MDLSQGANEARQEMWMKAAAQEPQRRSEDKSPPKKRTAVAIHSADSFLADSRESVTSQIQEEKDHI